MQTTCPKSAHPMAAPEWGLHVLRMFTAITLLHMCVCVYGATFSQHSAFCGVKDDDVFWRIGSKPKPSKGGYLNQYLPPHFEHLLQGARARIRVCSRTVPTG